MDQFMFDWEAENDRYSFEDSERFEEDSLCSWISEPESLCNNWRGWRKTYNGPITTGSGTAVKTKEDEVRGVTPLVEIAAQAVACNIPFEEVEHFYPPIPEQLQLRIAFWSFPESEEDIRLYSCLANGSADEFQKGEHLFKAKAVKDALQIGFHLSATVIPPQTVAQTKGTFNVAVVFDRRRITSCNCTCSSSASWCAHVVALCLCRIHLASSVCLRAPVSESLSRLHRDQLQKFAQYLISELPQQILPTAQRLLDELLSSQQTAINTVCGAPDPTAGPSASEQTTWCMDENTLHENIKKTLIKFCVPSPIVFSDVNYLSTTAPQAATEWQGLLRPLRGREPEGMWNLLSIVRELYKRNDTNAVPLLKIFTEEVLGCEQILVWWFNTKISTHNSGGGHGRGGQNSNSSSQHAASSLCDEIVTLWRLAALDPRLVPGQRQDLCSQLMEWHLATINKVRKARGTNVPGGSNSVKKSDIEIFSGFKSGIEACQMSWDDYDLVGITSINKEIFVNCVKSPQECSLKDCQITVHTAPPSFRTLGAGTSKPQGIISGSRSPKRNPGLVSHAVSDTDAGYMHTDGACSSSSEGFCDSYKGEGSQLRDSDSDFENVDSASKESTLKASRPKHGLAGHSVASPSEAKHGLACSFPGISSELVSSFEILEANSEPSPGTSSSPDPGVDVSAGKKPEIKKQIPKPRIEDHDSDSSVPGAGACAGPSSASLGVKGDVSESQPSSDEYQLYFYDTKAKLPETPEKKKPKEEPNYFAGMKKIENKQDIAFARAEALHAHGHTNEACKLAKELAEEMLANPPDLMAEPTEHRSKGKKKKAQSSISSFACTTLSKAAFLCTVLLEEPDCHHLAFQVGMFGLEMPRPPASNKALEVKLAHQEQELVCLLKKIPLGQAELTVIRDRAEKLRDGKLKSRGEALLPLTLAAFIFDSLCLPVCPVNGPTSKFSTRTSSQQPLRLNTDEKLGFDAAVAALGLKANVSEAEHPLLCEGTRRQRGDLAISMLVHYKDDQNKLSKVMDKLLDKEVHQLYKGPSLSTCLSSSASRTLASQAAAVSAAVPKVQEPPTAMLPAQPRRPSSAGYESDENNTNPADKPSTSCPMMPVPSTSGAGACANPPLRLPAGPRITAPPKLPIGGLTEMDATDPVMEAERLDYLNLEQNLASLNLSGVDKPPKHGTLPKYNSTKDTDSSALEEEGEGTADYKSWALKFRCTNLKSFKNRSAGMASIDSSAPETTSSDNSPTLVRRNWAKHQGPGSDSGSSGKSSDSLGSSSSGDKGAMGAKYRDNESPPGLYGPHMRLAPHMIIDSRSPTPNIKGARYKGGKNRVLPTTPNQPSEALGHFMFELAKTVLNKAGGNSSTSLFTQATTSNNPSGPHRALHLCAFQIGLYALGIYNCVSPNWLSRTYSSHVSWITGQAMEIGSAAINILIDTWEGHLTPPEVTSLADRASRGRDPNLVQAAAKLALSCLPQSHALNPNEIQRALLQCKEQSRSMLEKACLAVESAAKGGGVYPEVLFDVARRWYELYEETLDSSPNTARSQSVSTSQIVAPPISSPAVAVAASPPQPPVMAESSNASPLQVVQVSGHHATASAAPSAMVTVARPPAPQSTANQQPAAPALSYAIPQAAPVAHVPYIGTYSYIQQVPNFVYPPYMATYTYQGHPTTFANVPAFQAVQPPLYPANNAHFRQPTVHYANQASQAHPVQGRLPGQPLHHAAAQGHDRTNNQVVILNQQAAVANPHPPTPPQPANQDAAMSHTPQQLHMLQAAYRVGMLAMETLARRVHDDRPPKYSSTPPYGEDAKWLLGVAIKLGTDYIQTFCNTAVNAIAHPYVLQDIAIEAAQHMSRNNPTQVASMLRSPTLNSLMQKCLQMYIQCTHQKMHHINQNGYEELINMICSARNVFYMTTGGPVQFNELLQSLRRSKSCKKDLWQRIMNALATGNVQ